MGVLDELLEQLLELLEQLLEHLNLETIVTEVMKDLKITDLDIYFVVDKQPDSEEYELLGMAYSMKSASKVLEEQNRRRHTWEPEILKLDMSKLIAMIKAVGGLERVA